MIVLFIHQNFPGQYRNMVRALAEQPGNQVLFITQPNGNEMKGVRKVIYQTPILGLRNCHPYTVAMDDAIQHGVAVAGVCRMLRDEGVRPDLIVGHAGWGETLFVKDVFPDVPLLALFEYYFHANGADIDFDPEFGSVFNDPARLRVKNAIGLMAFDSVDWGHVATQWQRSVHPPELRKRITAIHEGVDTQVLKPDPDAKVQLTRQGITLTRKDPVVTYVARNLEPYRGFHSFMRALPAVLERNPKAHVLIVGGDAVSYGGPPPPGTTFREKMLLELGGRLDMKRVHFLGQIDYAAYIRVLQVSSAHVYLTYPFVLSWSFIEAMSCGCLMIGSATPPVEEVLEDGKTGQLVDFFDSDGIADRVTAALRKPQQFRRMRERAREVAVSRFDFAGALSPHWMRLFEDLVAGRRPENSVAAGRVRSTVTGDAA